MTFFRTLYQRYSADVFHFALYLTGNHDEAEDITSETFVRAWTSPAPIRTETVKGYLFTIARNLHRRGLRRSGRNVPLEESIEDPGADPLAVAEQKALLRAVMERLRALPYSDRSALLLRAVEGLTYEEIARALGISLAAVKTKIHRARLACAVVRNRQEDRR
jgi:RNA polymerase sigma-70 factor (ECF subfamily)